MKSSFLSFKRILTLAIFMFVIGFSYAQDGEALFNANCKSCHYATSEKLIGPGLQGIEKRRNRAWLYPWIKNSSAVIKSGDAYAVNIYNEYNKTAMTAQNLSNAEIDAVLDYIKKYVPPVAAPAAGVPLAGEPAEDGFPWLLLFVTSILIVVALALGRIQKSLQHALRDKEGQPHPALLKGKAFYKTWIRGNKKLIAGVLVIGALMSGLSICTSYYNSSHSKFIAHDSSSGFLRFFAGFVGVSVTGDSMLALCVRAITGVLPAGLAVLVGADVVTTASPVTIC